MPDSPAPVVIQFLRSKRRPRAILVDPDLNPRSLEELRGWQRDGRNFVVIDADTGDDITRIMLA
jgi:hypothetical protein